MQDETQNDRAAGALMIAAAALSVLMMAHHPAGYEDLFLARFVHGALIVLMLCIFAGFVRFAARRGLGRLPVLLGLVAYGAGTAGNLLAATMSGFLGPALYEADAPRAMLTLSWRLNQAFAFPSVYAVSAAFALWGADLILRGRSVDRLLGLAGLVAGLAPGALLATGVLNLHVSGAMIVYGAQLVFTAAVGLSLLRRL